MFAEGSRDHANLTPLQAKEKAKKMIDTSGRTALRQLEKFSQIGAFSKTFSDLLIGQEGWYSTKCKLTWKLRGTRFGRMYFQLVPSTLPTEGIEFGLLLKKLIPTPTAMDSTGATANMKSTQVKEGSMHSMTLSRFVMLPTPVTSDATTGAIIGKNDVFVQTKGLPRKINQNGVDGSVGLARLVQLLPTPTADDNPAKNTGKRNQDGLQKRAYQETGQTSQLSVQFVSEMMGYPIDYLELPFLNGETKG